MKVAAVSWRCAGNHLNADSEVSQYNRHIHMAGSLIPAAYTYGSSDNPENDLGATRLGRGLHGSPPLVVDGVAGEQLGRQLAERLTGIINAAVARGYGLTATADSLTVVSEQSFDPEPITATDRGAATALYTLRYNDKTNTIEYWAGHDWQPQNTPKTLVSSCHGDRTDRRPAYPSPGAIAS